MASPGRGAFQRLCKGLLHLNVSGRVAVGVSVSALGRKGLPVAASAVCNPVVSSTSAGASGLRLATWPSAGHLHYICPSEKLTTTPELVILEETKNAVFYDLPQTPNLISLIINPGKTSEKTEIIDPASGSHAPKEAREIMKIRRRKMNRHLLKKFRKRMRFTLRKIRRETMKKKEVAFQARLSGIKQWGDSFSARDWVGEELQKARRGGFYIDVLTSIRKTS